MSPGKVEIGEGGIGTVAVGSYAGTLALLFSLNSLAMSPSNLDFPVPGGPASRTFRRASNSANTSFGSLITDIALQIRDQEMQTFDRYQTSVLQTT
jgi:hypothetical protein